MEQEREQAATTTISGADALRELLERQRRIEEKIDSMIEFVNGATEQINEIAEQGIGGLLSGGLGSLFGRNGS